MTSSRWFGWALAAVAVLPNGAAAEEPAKVPGVAWMTRLSDAYAAAQAGGQPVLVRIESAGSDAARRLAAELDRPEARAELKRWVPVVLDAETSPEAKGFDVPTPPGLRIVTPHGHVVAGRDGFVRAADLVAWLRQHHDAAAAPLPPGLGATDPLTPEVVGKLVAALGGRDPVVREMAARRLLAEPRLAAKPVAEALARGGLQARLAARDLLTAWGGPTAGLDPWQPDTLTAQRLKEVGEWAAGPGPTAPPADRALTAAEREELRDELARLPAVPAAEAAAARERLVRFGPAARTAVLGAIAGAPTDLARERLAALRYRLAAADTLVLRWPGGLDRLASARPDARHDAAKELARVATPADESLLLELFADNDPFVRELSLRALQAASGKSATGTVARLLDDPDPNVRAAVLKQIAESPTAKLIAKVGEYLGKETDIDLVVHAVKALRAAHRPESLDHLRPLFKHESWRVRAEAVESAGEILSGLRQDAPPGVVTDGYKLIREALNDPDGFVVGRAIGALRKASKADDYEALVKAADRHPELAGAVVAALDYSSEQRAAALPHLKKFCRHPDPAVRAAAVKAVGVTEREAVAPEIRAALQDATGEVRRAAADAIFHAAYSARSNEESDARRGSVPKRAEGETLSARLGKRFADAVAPLEKLLTADDPLERLSAARVLVALGRERDAIPVVTAAAKKDPSLVSVAATVLPWVAPDRIGDLSRQFVALRPGPEPIDDLLAELGRVPGPEAKALLWELAARDDVPLATAGALANALESDRGSVRISGSQVERPPEQVKLIETAVGKAKAGPVLQRFAAVLLLASLERDRAAEPAAALAAAPDAAAIRRDALLVAMLTAPDEEAEKLAAAAAGEADPVVRRQGVAYLCFGNESSSRLPTTGSWLRLEQRYGRRAGYREFVPRVPRGLDPELARRLLADPDPATAAGAGYLLAVLGDPSGLPTLTRQWREHPDHDWARLLAFAIASLEDDAAVPILEEVYQQTDPLGEVGRSRSDVRELYWIIRPMEGPNALRLRKRMRAEVGMETIGTPG